MAVEKETLTVGETATILGISVRNAYTLARSGQLPGVKRLGNRFIISRKLLNEYLAEKTK